MRRSRAIPRSAASRCASPRGPKSASGCPNRAGKTSSARPLRAAPTARALPACQCRKRPARHSADHPRGPPRRSRSRCIQWQPTGRPFENWRTGHTCGRPTAIGCRVSVCPLTHLVRKPAKSLARQSGTPAASARVRPEDAVITGRKEDDEKEGSSSTQWQFDQCPQGNSPDEGGGHGPRDPGAVAAAEDGRGQEEEGQRPVVHAAARLRCHDQSPSATTSEAELVSGRPRGERAPDPHRFPRDPRHPSRVTRARAFAKVAATPRTGGRAGFRRRPTMRTI